MLYVLIILIMYGNIILYFQLYLQVSLLYNKMLIFSLSSEQLSMCGYFLYYNYMNWQHCLNACVLQDNIVNDQIYCSPGKVCEHRKEITRKCFMVFLVAVGL